MRRLFLALLSLAALAPAQAIAAPEADEIRRFVNSVTVESEGQIARFRAPLCPLSHGLPPAYNRVIEQRLRAVASAAGLAVDEKSGCTPNLIVFVADAAETVPSLLRRARPALLAGLSPAAINRVADTGGPVRAWQNKETRRADGDPILERRNAYLERDVHLLHGRPARMTSLPTQREINLAVVVFDLAAIDGLTLMQIADHAAVRGLAETRPAADGRSILALFDRDTEQAPPGLTRWDSAFLHALYAAAPAATADRQRSMIARRMERDLAAGLLAGTEP